MLCFAISERPRLCHYYYENQKREKIKDRDPFYRPIAISSISSPSIQHSSGLWGSPYAFWAASKSVACIHSLYYSIINRLNWHLYANSGHLYSGNFSPRGRSRETPPASQPASDWIWCVVSRRGGYPCLDLKLDRFERGGWRRRCTLLWPDLISDVELLFQAITDIVCHISILKKFKSGF